jgi:hypothetical protein
VAERSLEAGILPASRRVEMTALRERMIDAMQVRVSSDIRI